MQHGEIRRASSLRRSSNAFPERVRYSVKQPSGRARSGLEPVDHDAQHRSQAAQAGSGIWMFTGQPATDFSLIDSKDQLRDGAILGGRAQLAALLGVAHE